MRLVPVDAKLAKWAHDLAAKGHTVCEIKEALQIAIKIVAEDRK